MELLKKILDKMHTKIFLIYVHQTILLLIHYNTRIIQSYFVSERYE